MNLTQEEIDALEYCINEKNDLAYKALHKIKASQEDVRNDIENIVASVCDSTWQGLDRAKFVWNRSPRELADKIIEYIGSMRK